MQAARSNYTILFKKKKKKSISSKKQSKVGKPANSHQLLLKPPSSAHTDAGTTCCHVHSSRRLQRLCQPFRVLLVTCPGDSLPQVRYLIHAALLLTAKHCCRDSVSGENKSQQKTYMKNWERTRKWNETRVYNIYYLVILLLLIYNYIHILLY